MKCKILETVTDVPVENTAGIPLRFYVDGDYPIVAVIDNNESEPKTRGQYFEFVPDGSPIAFKGIGGNSVLNIVEVIGTSEIDYILPNSVNTDKLNLPFMVIGNDVIFKGKVKASNLNISTNYSVSDNLLTGKAIDDGVSKIISNLEQQWSAKIALLEYRIKQLEDKNE